MRLLSRLRLSTSLLVLRQVAAIPIPYVWRVRASDWDGTQLVGTNITFTQAAVDQRPALVDGTLRFDGMNDLLTATVNTNLVGKTLIWVATPRTTDATTDAIISMTGAGSLTFNIEAQTLGAFNSRLRTANFGAGTTLLSAVTTGNAQVNQANTRFIGLTKITASEIVNINGATAAGTTTLTAGAKTVTSVRLGANTTTSYCPVDIFEVALIDSTDDAVLQAAINQMQSAYSVTGPLMGPYLDKESRIFGDSISLGIGATPSSEGFIEQVADALILDTNKSGFAGAQMSPVTIPALETARIAACFSRVTATAANYTGMHIIFVHFGVNDFRTDVPLGVITDSTEDTFYGAMRVGFDNIAINAPTLPVMVTAPFYMDGEDIPNAEGHILQDYRNAIQAVCASRNISFLNMGNLWNASNSATYLDDGLHPSNAGYDLGRDLLLPVIRAGVNIPGAETALKSYTYTVPAAKVSSDLTSFNTYIDLGAQFPASFWSNVTEDGGNIRVYDTNGVTLLPHDVIHVSPRAQIGELVVRRSITTAGGTSFKIKLLDPALAKLTNTHPAGRNAVWADYEAVYYIGHDPFDRTGRAGSLRVIGDPDLLKEVAASPDVNGHEGVATDGTHYYVFDSFAIRKYTLAWSLVTQITDVATRYSGGLGGGCVSNGVIYVAADNTGTQYLAKYNASDLSFITDHNIEGFANAAADFCMVNGELHTVQYVTSPGTGTIVRINPDTGANLGTIALSQNLVEAQGITFWRNAYWISVDNVDETFRVTPTGTVTSSGLFGPSTTGNSWEGLDVAPNGDGLICMDDMGTSEIVRTFKDADLLGAMGGGASHPTNSQMIADLTSAGILGTTWTVGATIFATTTEQRYFLGVVPTGAYSATQSVHIGTDFIGVGDSRLAIFDGSNSWQYAAGNAQVSTVAPQRVNVVYDGVASRSIYVNGGSKGTDLTVTSRGTGIAHLVIGGAAEASTADADSWRGQTGFVYARKQALSDAWLAAEYSNLSNPSGFGTITEDVI